MHMYVRARVHACRQARENMWASMPACSTRHHSICRQACHGVVRLAHLLHGQAASYSSVKQCQDWERLFRKTIDKGNDGTVSFGEFRDAARRYARVTTLDATDALLAKIFRRVDEDGTGFVSLPELVHFLENYGAAKRRADERKKAEDEARREREEEEEQARRKREAEAAARRNAEDNARRKKEAEDEAQRKREAEEAASRSQVPRVAGHMSI